MWRRGTEAVIERAYMNIIERSVWYGYGIVRLTYVARSGARQPGDQRRLRGLGRFLHDRQCELSFCEDYQLTSLR